MEKTNSINVKHVVIDPSAIGLFGLAMVTLVASSQKLGITSGVSGIIPWAIFLGAIAQLVAAAYDAKHNNVFGATAFFGYGLFWLGIASTWMVQSGIFGAEFQSAFDPNELGIAFIGYLIFTLIMTIGAIETNKVLLIIFILIDLLFIGLSLSTFGIAYHETHMLAGFAKLGIAIVSFYGVAANVLNQHFNRTFLPLGKPLGIFKK
ncbi:acetate uptake transporter [Mycoplasma sp. P36-A1]|uniref:acetate uptake transporter n=1 Tax=Mycoplasma sp. P36-A1 TaxID=3252900 RepID=UPI003C2CCB53